jgi:hypothetical protein
MSVWVILPYAVFTRGYMASCYFSEILWCLWMEMSLCGFLGICVRNSSGG